jgi:hypothetical protein
MLNPYETPQSAPSANLDDAEHRNNRARPLLYLIGGIVVVIAISMFMGWEARGPRTQVYAVASLAFGIVGFWLGHRPFDAVSRWGTILWGTIATLALSATSRPPLHFPTLLIVGSQLLGVVSIPIIAFRQRSAIRLSDRVQSAPSDSVKD